jgi:hypothetical protein
MIASLPRGESHPDVLVRGEDRGGEREVRQPVEVYGEGNASPLPVNGTGKSLPRLRGDLTVSQQVTAKGVIFVIKDPLLDRFYRFPEQAYFIASQLDGKTELDVVRKRTEEKFQTSLAPEELTAFLGTLTASGLLDSGKNENAKAACFTYDSDSSIQTGSSIV